MIFTTINCNRSETMMLTTDSWVPGYSRTGVNR